MILNVGCGFRKLGPINIDIDKQVRPDVLCDAHHLPFKNECFHRVLGFAVLEHVDNPIRVTEEMFRVCKNEGKVTVLFPCNSLLYSDIISNLMNGRVDSMIKQRLAFKRGVHKWQLNIEYMLNLFDNFGQVTKCMKPSYRYVYGRKGYLLRRFVRFPCWGISTIKNSYRVFS